MYDFNCLHLKFTKKIKCSANRTRCVTYRAFMFYNEVKKDFGHNCPIFFNCSAISLFDFWINILLKLYFFLLLLHAWFTFSAPANADILEEDGKWFKFSLLNWIIEIPWSWSSSLEPLISFMWLVENPNSLNPWTPTSDWEVTSPHNIYTLSSKQVMRILKLIT